MESQFRCWVTKINENYSLESLTSILKVFAKKLCGVLQAPLGVKHIKRWEPYSTAVRTTLNST